MAHLFVSCCFLFTMLTGWCSFDFRSCRCDMFTLCSVPRRKLRLFKKLQVFLRGLRCVTNSQGNKGPTTCFYTLHNINLYSHKKIISCKFTNAFYWKYKVWSAQTPRIKDQPNQKPAFSFVLSLIHWGRLFCLHIESSVTALCLTAVQHGQFVAAVPFHICKPYFQVSR